MNNEEREMAQLSVQFYYRPVVKTQKQEDEEEEKVIKYALREEENLGMLQQTKSPLFRLQWFVDFWKVKKKTFKLSWK